MCVCAHERVGVYVWKSLCIWQDLFVSLCRKDEKEYALKQIEGTGISMSACREIAVSRCGLLLLLCVHYFDAGLLTWLEQINISKSCRTLAQKTFQKCFKSAVAAAAMLVRLQRTNVWCLTCWRSFRGRCLILREEERYLNCCFSPWKTTSLTFIWPLSPKPPPPPPPAGVCWQGQVAVGAGVVCVGLLLEDDHVAHWPTF